MNALQRQGAMDSQETVKARFDGRVLEVCYDNDLCNWQQCITAAKRYFDIDGNVMVIALPETMWSRRK
jgi:hypothetical protein